MKIVVPIKSVKVLADEFELADDNLSVDEDAIERDLNEWDSFSLEAALELVEEHGGEVVVVSVGDEDAEEAIRGCLARGAERGVRIWADELDDDDPLVVARLLAAAVGREEADLVLCGVQSSDAVNGATGVALGALLGIPWVAVVTSISVSGSDRITVERELEGGTVELLELSWPALLTIQSGINSPRYANLRAIKRAAAKPLEVLDPKALGIEEASRPSARTRRLAPPDEGGGAQMLEGDPERLAEQIAELLRERVGVGS